VNATRFRALVEAYGSDPSHWPADERQAALGFVAASPEARAVLDAEAPVDRLLDSLENVEPSAELVRRVREIPLRHDRAGALSLTWPFGRLRNVLTIALAAAAAGVFAGLAVPDTVPGTDAEATWDELSDVPLGGEIDEEPMP
jgi:hypothetical protein